MNRLTPAELRCQIMLTAQHDFEETLQEVLSAAIDLAEIRTRMLPAYRPGDEHQVLHIETGYRDIFMSAANSPEEQH